MKPDFEKLLEKYYAGETTLEEEKQLREFFNDESVPARLQHEAAPFRYAADARNDYPSARFTRQATNRLDSAGRIYSLTSWSLRLAASLVLLAGGFASGLYYSQRSSTSPETASTVAIKKVLEFDQVAQTSASERIQAVNQSSELPEADQEVTKLLINTLNFDDNVNVRLAACQALMRFPNEPGVREALIQSLTIQTDPYVQIMLIEALVTVREKRAADVMQRLIRNQQVIEAVRQKAEEGLNRLSPKPSAS
ncbi:HEAT repeat domain-containing protein [Larkinella sp. VNQ87]|uniref:HEAT repeat domain-containing protein n=1 Tax=Larkinella sp. VNQ87 TaxID=3400921 RepID=UPI003C057A6E